MPDEALDVQGLLVLNAILEKINQGNTLQEVFETSYERLREVLPYNRIGIALTDPSGERITLVAAKSDGPMHLGAGYSGRIAGSSLEEVLRRGRPRLLNDLEEYLRQKPGSESTRLIVKEGMRSSLTLPLLVRGRPVGIMFFSSREKGAYTGEHELLLRQVAGHIAVMVEKGRLTAEREKAQEALRRANAELEDRVRERTSALEGEIAARVKTEEVLRESQQRLQAILDCSTAVIFLKDVEGRYLLVNRSFESVFRTRQDQLVGKTDFDLLPRERAEAFRANDRKVLEAGVPMEWEEMVPQDDGTHTYLANKFPLRNAAGAIYAVCGIAADITDRKRAEEDLRTLNDELGTRVRRRTRELEDRVQERTRLLEELARKNEEREMLLRLSTELISAQELGTLLERTAAILAESFRADAAVVVLLGAEGAPDEVRAALGLPPAFVGTHVRRDEPFFFGEEHGIRVPPQCAGAAARVIELPVEFRAAGFHSGAAAPLVSGGKVLGSIAVLSRAPAGFPRDAHRLIRLMANQVGVSVANLTHYDALRDAYENLRATQEALVNSARLAAVGEMAASVAHEIKNPLAGISGAVQVMRDTLDPEHPHREIMEEVLTQVRRLDQTIRDLLAFSRPSRPAVTPLDLRAVVERIRPILAGDPSLSALDIRTEGLDGLGPLDADPHLLEDVLFNLLANAAHAMPGGGPVTISGLALAHAMQIHVRDRGPGLSDEAREKLFRPFFTTKVRGTGLGLAICQKIMEAHGGSIHVENAPGGGTDVALTFPKSARTNP